MMQKYYINSKHYLSIVFLLRIINIQCIHVDEHNVQYINSLLFQQVFCISVNFSVLHKIQNKYEHMLIISEYDNIYTFQCAYTIILIYCRNNNINIFILYNLMCNSDIYGDGNIYTSLMSNVFQYSVGSAQKQRKNYLSVYSLINGNCKSVLKYKQAILNIIHSNEYNVNIYDIYYLLNNNIDKQQS